MIGGLRKYATACRNFIGQPSERVDHVGDGHGLLRPDGYAARARGAMYWRDVQSMFRFPQPVKQVQRRAHRFAHVCGEGARCACLFEKRKAARRLACGLGVDLDH